MAKILSSYFPHDSDARLDIKIRRLRKALGAEGYGIYWMILEVLREQEFFEYPIGDIDLLADEFKTSIDKVTAVIRSFELFEFNDDKTFYSTSLIARLEPYLQKSINARAAANKRWEEAKKLKEAKALLKSNDSSLEDEEFEKFWELYNKKVSKDKTLKLWQKLSKKNKAKIFKTLPAYLESKPDKQFRKNPDVYLRNKSWEDEIISTPDKNNFKKVPEIFKGY